VSRIVQFIRLVSLQFEYWHRWDAAHHNRSSP